MEHVAANDTLPPINGSLFMNFENSAHSWSIADCRNKLISPSPLVITFQTSTISKNYSFNHPIHSYRRLFYVIVETSSGYD